MFVFVTASVGILSADCAGCGVTCLLGLYHALMVLLLLIQVLSLSPECNMSMSAALSHVLIVHTSEPEARVLLFCVCCYFACAKQEPEGCSLT